MQAHIVVNREGMDQQQFSDTVNNPSVRVIDVNGHELVYNGSNSGSGGNDAYETRLMFSSRVGGPEAAAPGDPATPLWELPTAVQEITIPFEFTDLPLP